MEAKEVRWHNVLGDAQEAVENAGKSTLYHFRPIPKTHDLDKELKELIQRSDMPTSIEDQLKGNLDVFQGMGIQAHIPPWTLIKRREALAAPDKARRGVALAEAIYKEMAKPKGKSE